MKRFTGTSEIALCVQKTSALAVTPVRALGVLFKIALVVLFAAFLTPLAHADGPDLHAVSFEQKLDAQVPLDLAFRNEHNQQVTLGELIRDKPVVLTLNYLRCEQLCPLELNDLAQSLSQLSFDLGKQFDVVTVSIDPRETPIIAANKRQLLLPAYTRFPVETGWHFLTGDAASIEKLANAVGFHFAYDARTDEFAHPLGVIVLTPQGRVARYIYGLGYEPRDLRLALVEASERKIGNPVDQIMLFCFHYDSSQGAYTGVALNFVQVGALLGVVALGGFLGMLWVADRRRTTK